MKTLTILCNIVLLGFTGFVLVADGVSREPIYIVFTLLLVLIPIFTVFAIVHSEAGNSRPGGDVKHNTLYRVAAVCNVVLFGSVCWAVIDQYPHPEEPGLVPFTMLAVLTPIISAVTLFRKTGARLHSTTTGQRRIV